MKLKNPFKMPTLLILGPVVLVMILDLVFTLVGQPEAYWQNFQFFNEASPIGQKLLMTHPIFFILSFIFYTVFVLFLIVNLKRPLNIILALSAFLGHSWGSSSWVPKIFFNLTGFQLINNYYLILSYFILIAVFSGFCLNLWLKKQAKL